MDHLEEDCIAVGSTGTLLALMDKEMEILQARKSCSVSYNNQMLHCKKSPYSPKDPNTLYASYSIFGSPLMSPPSTTSLVSSLWNDLKSLLRSPTSMYHHNAHTHALFCKEQLEISEDSAALCNKSPSHPSPLTSLSHLSPTRAYPEQAMPHSQAPPPIRSPSSKQTYPKEKVAAEASPHSTQKPPVDDGYIKKKAEYYPHGKSPLHYNCSRDRILAVPGAADYPNRKSPLHYRSQDRTDLAYGNWKGTDVCQVTPTGTDRHKRKGNTRPSNEQSLAGTAAAKTYPKEKITMDAKSPNVQNPIYPKANAMDAVYAMRRSTAMEADHSQNGKVLQDKDAKSEGARTFSRSRKSCSRKREERANTMQNETYCVQKREERGYVQNYGSMQKREERERMQDEDGSRMQRREESVCCMQESCKCCMQKPMLEERQKEACTPASSPSPSPLNMRPCFKPSQSFGGRALPLVSVVDLQCCLTPDPSSRRLSFTRLSSF